MENNEQAFKFGVLDEQKFVCDKHGEYAGSPVQIGENKIKPPCPECLKENGEKESRENQARKAKEDQKRIDNLVSRSGIQRRFINLSFDGFSVLNDEAKSALNIAKLYAMAFDRVKKNGWNLIFCGNAGTGKTHLACSIASHAISEHNATVLYITTYELVLMIRESWGRKSEKTERQILREFTIPDLIIIDEVGLQCGTENETLLLSHVINSRYAEMKPTIIITNLKPTEIPEYLGERAVERLLEGKSRLVPFTWGSYRRDAKSRHGKNVDFSYFEADNA